MFIHYVIEMVRYTCERCKRTFAKKSQYDQHINRKIPCPVNDVEPEILLDYKCKCGKICNRIDSLTKHINKYHEGDMTYNLGTGQQINGDHNNGNHNNSHNKNVNININNYIGMAPFGKDGIDFLTFDEKLKVFFSNFSPLEALILIVNLDDKRYLHHNVGYPSEKAAWGNTYNGIIWNKTNINFIIETLLSSKCKDLVDIGNDLKDVLSEEDIQHVEKGVNKSRETRLNLKLRNTFASFVKQHLYNKRHLAKNAMKVMEAYCTDSNIILKPSKEPKFRGNIDYEEARQIQEQTSANRIQVTTYKNILNETIKLYKTKGIITQKEIDYVLEYIINIHHVE